MSQNVQRYIKIYKNVKKMYSNEQWMYKKCAKNAQDMYKKYKKLAEICKMLSNVG